MSIYFYYTTLQDFYFSMNPIWYYFISFLDLMTRILFYDTVISFLVCWIYNYIPFYYCIIFLLLSLFVFSYYYQNCVYCTSLKKKKNPWAWLILFRLHLFVFHWFISFVFIIACMKWSLSCSFPNFFSCGITSLFFWPFYFLI